MNIIYVVFIKIFIYFKKSELTMLPSQVQAVIIEQNKIILGKFAQMQMHKTSALSYSGTNSMDGETGSYGNIVANATNVLQIPTISKNNPNRFN